MGGSAKRFAPLSENMLLATPEPSGPEPVAIPGAAIGLGVVYLIGMHEERPAA